MRNATVLLLAIMTSTLALPAVAEIAGVWTLTVETPRGTQHPTLTITSTPTGYTGVYTGARGELPIARIEADGDNFSFPLTVTMPMGEVELKYSGTVTGDSVAGEIGNPMGSVPFVGVRAN